MRCNMLDKNLYKHTLQKSSLHDFGTIIRLCYRSCRYSVIEFIQRKEKKNEKEEKITHKIYYQLQTW
jgi:hypothetical protein